MLDNWRAGGLRRSITAIRRIRMLFEDECGGVSLCDCLRRLVYGLWKVIERRARHMHVWGHLLASCGRRRKEDKVTAIRCSYTASCIVLRRINQPSETIKRKREQVLGGEGTLHG